MQLDPRFVKVAHDPGDPVLCSHCPFCGSGQITGRSDGGIDCAFCGQSFIVRVQPAFPGMPQAPGMGAPTDVGPDMGAMPPPGMEGEEGMPPGMEGGEGMPPGAEGEEEGPPFGDEDEEGGEPGEEAEEEGGPEDEAEGPPPPKKKTSARAAARRYRTLAGDLLGEDAYIRHLAILHSGMSPSVLRLVRQAAQSRDCPRCRSAVPDNATECPQCKWPYHKPRLPGARNTYPVVPGIEQADIDPGRSAEDDRWLKEHGIEAARRMAYLTTGDDPHHRAKYDAGYSASEGFSGYRNPGSSPLEDADMRGEPDSWYQGYLDHATDRPYGHAIECPAHDHDGPGCTLYDQPERFDPMHVRRHDTAWLSQHQIRGSRRAPA
jgi:hypothetical protein